MAVSLKQKWLRILTQIAENTEDSRIAIDAIKLGLLVQTSEKKPGKALTKQLNSIFGTNKPDKKQDNAVEKPS
jgi:hypothetical protein